MRVRFVFRDTWETVKPVHLPGEMSYEQTVYLPGQVYDLEERLARRFVDRGSAEFVEDAKAATPEPPVLSTEGEEAAPAGSSDPAAPPPAPSAAPPRPPKKPR